MSKESFIRLLQSLLTMVDPDDPYSVKCVERTLENIFMLARESKKCDPFTMRLMLQALSSVQRLIVDREDFIGKPGQYATNVAKRHRLEQMLMPGC